MYVYSFVYQFNGQNKQFSICRLIKQTNNTEIEEKI